MPDKPSSARQRTLVLASISVALMTVVSAVSGLNVALPSLAVDTGATQTQVTWIVDAYTVVFVGLLLPAGAIGDRFGRRGILLTGLAVFGAAAGCALFVDDPNTLIGLRALMGAGAAGVMPTTLSIITTSFPEAERGRAIGVWVGVAGSGAVLGLFGSGVLLEYYSWNSFFALNVALAVVAIAGTLRFVPGSRDDHAPRLDPLGALTGLAGVVGLVFGIIEGPERGWSDLLTVGGFVIGAAGLVAFVLWERHLVEPMLDPRLFARRGFSAGSLAITAQFFASFGFFYIVLQYLQYVVGYSPLVAATCLLPLPLVLIPLSRNAPRIAGRVGLRPTIALGLALSGTGLLLLTALGTDFAYWQLAVGLVVFAAGMGLAGTPGTTAITNALPRSKQGVASAVNDTARELGSALGIAVLGSVLNSAYRTNLDPALTGVPHAVADRARSSVSSVDLGADRFGARGHQLVAAAEQSFVDAATTAFLVGGIVLLVIATVVVFLAPGRTGENADADEVAREVVPAG